MFYLTIFSVSLPKSLEQGKAFSYNMCKAESRVATMRGIRSCPQFFFRLFIWQSFQRSCHFLPICANTFHDPVPGLPFHECFPPLTSLALCVLDDDSLITWTGKLFLPLCRCCDPTTSSLCYNCLCLKTPSLISSGESRSADGDVSVSCSDSPPDGRLFRHTLPFA